MLADVPPDLPRVRPCVLSQRPADRLAEEELPRGERGLDHGVEQLEIRVLLEGELAEDGAPPLPEVVRAAPGEHLPPHLAREAAQQRAEAVRGDAVDEVPPRAGHDHLLVHRQGGHVLEPVEPPEFGELDRAVALLPEPRAPPQGEHRPPPGRGRRELDGREDLAADLPERDGRHPEERQGGLRVGLHGRGPLRLRHAREGRSQGCGQRHGIHGPVLSRRRLRWSARGRPPASCRGRRSRRTGAGRPGPP